MTQAQISIAGMRGRALRLVGGRSLRVFLVRSLGVGALLGLEIVLAQWLGVAGYGTFSFMLAAAALISRLAPLGWLNASTRLVTIYRTTGQHGLLKGTLLTAHATTLLCLAAIALVLLLVGQVWGVTVLAAYALPLTVALTLLELHRFMLRGFNAGDVGEALPMLLLPALMMAAVWMLDLHAVAPAAHAYAAVCVGLVLVSTGLILRNLPAGLWSAPAEIRLREWSGMALAMQLGALGDELVARTAVLVLGAMGNEAGAGLYQAAARLALMNLFVLRALTPVAGPRMSSLFHEGRLAELRGTYRRLCLTSLLGCLPFFVAGMLFPERILGLFGPSFVDAAPVLRILSVGYLVSAATGPCATGLMMIGRQGLYGWVGIAMPVLNVAATYLLVQSQGAIGAAIATSAVIAGTNLIYAAVFLRALRDPT